MSLTKNTETKQKNVDRIKVEFTCLYMFFVILHNLNKDMQILPKLYPKSLVCYILSVYYVEGNSEYVGVSVHDLNRAASNVHSVGMLHLPGTHVVLCCCCQAGRQVVEDTGSPA